LCVYLLQRSSLPKVPSGSALASLANDPLNSSPSLFSRTAPPDFGATDLFSLENLQMDMDLI
jgi:hypothetical protein